VCVHQQVEPLAVRVVVPLIVNEGSNLMHLDFSSEPAVFPLDTNTLIDHSNNDSSSCVPAVAHRSWFLALWLCGRQFSQCLAVSRWRVAHALTGAHSCACLTLSSFFPASAN